MLADGEPIGRRSVIWAAGVIASPAAKWLGAEADRAGRVMVTRLHVPGDPEVFVIGDTAAGEGADGRLCRASRPRPSRWAAMSGGDRCAACRKAANRSATATTAISPPSAARRPLRISAGSGSPAFSPGCCGPRTCLVPDRLAQPVRRVLDWLGLCHLRARRPADHRTPAGLIRTACDRRESRSAPRPCRRAARP